MCYVATAPHRFGSSSSWIFWLQPPHSRRIPPPHPQLIRWIYSWDVVHGISLRLKLDWKLLGSLELPQHKRSSRFDLRWIWFPVTSATPYMYISKHYSTPFLWHLFYTAWARKDRELFKYYIIIYGSHQTNHAWIPYHCILQNDYPGCGSLRFRPGRLYGISPAGRELCHSFRI